MMPQSRRLSSSRRWVQLVENVLKLTWLMEGCRRWGNTLAEMRFRAPALVGYMEAIENQDLYVGEPGGEAPADGQHSTEADLRRGAEPVSTPRGARTPLREQVWEVPGVRAMWRCVEGLGLRGADHEQGRHDVQGLPWSSRSSRRQGHQGGHHSQGFLFKVLCLLIFLTTNVYRAAYGAPVAATPSIRRSSTRTPTEPQGMMVIDSDEEDIELIEDR